jgi:hypothetical protein
LVVYCKRSPGVYQVGEGWIATDEGVGFSVFCREGYVPVIAVPRVRADGRCASLALSHLSLSLSLFVSAS